LAWRITFRRPLTVFIAGPPTIAVFCRLTSALPDTPFFLLNTHDFLQKLRILVRVRRVQICAHFAESDRSFRQSVTDAEMLHG